MTETAAFNPSEHLRTIKTRQGNMPYLNAKGRILWLRHEHPDASIVTEQVDGGLVHEMVAFKATISYEVDGRAVMATGHGSETVKDFPDYYEKAETKAIARACAVLGYGTEGATDFDNGEPLDGLPAAKAERAARRMEPNERQQVDAQHERNTTPPPPRQPEPSRISAVRSHPAPGETATLSPWQPPADVKDTAHLIAILNQHYSWTINPETKLRDIIDVIHAEYQRDGDDLIPFDTDREGKQTRYPSTVWRWVKERATPTQQ